MRESDSFQKDPVIKKAKQQSNFRAIKNLLHAENSIRVAHNRIRVLQSIDQKNTNKLQNQVGLIEKIQQVRDSSALHSLTIESSKQQMQQEAEEARSKYLQLSCEHRERIKQAQEGVRKNKKWQYLSMEEQSQQADRLISQQKLSVHQEHAKTRLKISAEEEQGKKSLIQFHENKQSRIKEVKVGEVSEIKNKQAARYKELRDLSNVEMQLIQKQSQSQAAYLEVKSKLDSLLNNVKLQSNLSKKSLKTSVHLQGRENHIDA